MLKKLIRNIIICNIIFILIAFLVSAFYPFDVVYFALGILTGTIFTIAKLILMNRSITRTVEMKKNLAGITTFINYLVRYLLTGVALYMMIKISFTLFWASVLSMIFATKIGIYTVKGNVLDGNREGV